MPNMTDLDRRTIEMYAKEVAEGMGFTAPPVVLSKEYDRIDIHTDCMKEQANEKFADLLAQVLGRHGWLVDVWPIYPGRVFVSYKEEES